jgi:hypothetical protein
MGQSVDKHLREAGIEFMTSADAIIRSYHQRGADELVHRAFKDFGFAELPFLRFAPNAAFYYIMLLGFFLFEAFKANVTQPVVPVVAFPTTLRCKLVDVAAKAVSHAAAWCSKSQSLPWRPCVSKNCGSNACSLHASLGPKNNPSRKDRREWCAVYRFEIVSVPINPGLKTACASPKFQIHQTDRSFRKYSLTFQPSNICRGVIAQFRVFS